MRSSSSATGVSSAANLNADSQGSGGALVTTAPALHNGSSDETMFTKPPARDGMTHQVKLFLFLSC